MAFATLAGLALPCARDGATDLPPEQGGTTTRAFAGGRRSTVRWEKRGWQFKLTPMLPATAATMKAAIALKAQVALAGDVVDGGSVLVDCDVLDAPMLSASGSPVGFWRVLTIRCYEV